MLCFRLGPWSWSVELCEGKLTHPETGRRCLALCDTDRNWIGVTDVKPPDDRMRLFWHELAHAWIAELHPVPEDERLGEPLSEETLCNLVAMGRSLVSRSDEMRIECYLKNGIACDSIMLLPGRNTPIPFINARI